MDVEVQNNPQVSDVSETEAGEKELGAKEAHSQNEACEALTQMSELSHKFDRDIMELNEELAQVRNRCEEIEVAKEAARREADEQFQEIMKLTIEKITRTSWLQRRQEHADWQQAFLDHLEETLNHIIGGTRYGLWVEDYVDSFVNTWEHLRDDNVKKALARLNERIRELRIQLTKESQDLEEKKKYYEIKKQEQERARLAEEKRRQEEEERRRKMEEERILNEKKRQKEELLGQVRESESVPRRQNPFRTISFDPTIPIERPSFDQFRATVPTFGFSSKSFSNSSTTSRLNETIGSKEAKQTNRSSNSPFPTFSQLARF